MSVSSSDRPPLLRQYYAWLFAPPAEPRSTWDVIVWWEKRRIAYNLFVGVIGVISLSLLFMIGSGLESMKPGAADDGFPEPLGLLLMPILVNFAYTAGWAGESFLRFFVRERRAQIGPFLLRAGFGSSLFVVLVPVIAGSILLLNAVIHRH